jgi:hypothetical protein
MDVSRSKPFIPPINMTKVNEANKIAQTPTYIQNLLMAQTSDKQRE